MAESARPDRVRYRFPPLERRGVIAGWRGGQIASVAVSLVFAVLALRSHPSVGGIILALVSVAVGVALAFWPILGRTGEQWLPLAATWVWSTATGGRRQLAAGPRRGHEVTVDSQGHSPEVAHTGNGPGAGRQGRSRTVFGGLSLQAMPLGAEPSAQAVGMVVDRPSRTATAVLALRGHSFALLGPRDQDSQIGAWARVLSAMAREGSGVHRLQWIESCLPDDGSAVRAHWARQAVLGPESRAGRSYQALVDESRPVTRRHQVLLAVSVNTGRSARSIRSSGGGMAGAAAVLAREVLSLHQALEGADITVDGALGPAALSRVIADTWAPMTGTGGGTGTPGGAVGSRHEVPGALSGGDDTGPRWPWPMAVEPHWDAVHVDGTWHATYWIAEWPRVDVTPDFLGPMLFSPLRRSIVLTMEPVSPSRAVRQVAQARTADLADSELRRRGGFLVTARHTREKESVEDRDGELADGHAQYRFSGYATVTADTRAELAAACAAVEQAAGQARIEVRLLYGEQDVAFTCSLPLGRGLS